MEGIEKQKLEAIHDELARVLTDYENGEKLRTIHIHPELETIICIDLHKNQN